MDDDDKRFKSFQLNMIGANVERAKVPNEAIDMLYAARYDAIFLDFDLDEEHTGVNGYGTDITKWIKDNAANEWLQSAIYLIHSLNKTGSLKMQAELAEAGLKGILVPFAWRYMTPADIETFKDDQ